MSAPTNAGATHTVFAPQPRPDRVATRLVAILLVAVGLLASFATPVAAAPPGVVGDLIVTAGTDSVTATWTAPIDDGGSPITAYAVTLSGTASASLDIDDPTWTFEGLAPGPYTVSVFARNADGDSAAVEANTTIEPPPITTPSPPTDVTATATGQTVEVTWTASADNGGEAPIYLISVNGVELESAGTSISFNDVAPGTHTAAVAASNTGGTSAPVASNPVTVNSPAAAPAAPLNLAANSAGAGFEVTWDAPAANGSPITGYNVNVNGAVSNQVGTGLTVTTPGSYSVSVTAVNGAGESPPAGPVEFSIAAPVTSPGPATGVVAQDNGQTVTVTWDAPGDNGGDPDLAYTVTLAGQRSETEALTVTFTNVTPGTHTAQVTVSNSVGSSAPASSGPVVVDAPIVPPGPAGNPTAAVSGQSVTVTWTAPGETGGAPVSYEVGLTGQSPQTTDGLTATFADLGPGQYTATVTSSNVAGEGGDVTSNTVTVAAPATVPGPPGNLTDVETSTGVAVSWEPPANNGGADITGYRVTVNGNATTQTATSLEVTDPGEYNVTVAAINTIGTGTASGPVTFTISPPIVSPGTPGNVNASVSGSTVTVSWDRPSDGGDPELVYLVTLSNGQTRATDEQSVQFNGVGPGTYTASVTASNSVGTGGAGTSGQFSIFGPPGRPRDVSAAGVGSSIVVSWDAPGSDGNSPLRGYEVRLEQDGNVLNTRDLGSDSDATEFTDLDPGVYTVVVTARNDQGAGPSGSSAVEVGATTPSAPRNVSGSARFLTVTVTWDPPQSAGNTPLTGYEVQVGDTVQAVDAGTRSVVLADIPPGNYSAQVVAINDGGKSLPASSDPFNTETLFAPFETSDALIEQQYRDFLGREADAAGVRYWQGVLGGDRTLAPAVIESFMRSAEFAPRRSIARLYLAFFDRSPDREGFDFWAGVIRNGGELNDIAAAFSGSQEFVNTYGELNDAEFIALVYNNVLIRRPDLEGFQFWISKLKEPGISRGDLMVAFSESAEFKRESGPAVDVIMTYRGMLDRAPDPAGFIFWVNAVAGQADALQTLILNFLVAPEYSNRVR